METINFKRTKIGLAVFALLMMLLLCRVFYIQIICHEELEAMAVSQYAVEIQGIDFGHYYYFVLKENEDSRLNRFVNLLEGKQVENGGSAYYVFKTENFNSLINESLIENYGAYVMKSNEDSWLDEDSLPIEYSIYVWADASGKVLLGERPKLKNGTNQEILAQRVSAIGAASDTA